jgi:hypothetical protein
LFFKIPKKKTSRTNHSQCRTFFQNEEKKTASELIIANKELAFQNKEKKNELKN